VDGLQLYRFCPGVLAHMDRVGRSPDVTAYNFIMLGYASQGDARTALRLCAEMQAKEIAPNIFTFINLVRACAAASCPDQALRIVDGKFPWEFYTAAITILHQYGHYPQADSLYQLAVQYGKARGLNAKCELDLHGMNVPVAAAAVRCALKDIAQSWHGAGEGSLRDLVLITGVGKGSLVEWNPVLRPHVQDLLVEQFYPPIDSVTQPGNPGRVVVTGSTIRSWLKRLRYSSPGGAPFHIPRSA
jgi:pentatricopeptide repeat protein